MITIGNDGSITYSQPSYTREMQNNKYPEKDKFDEDFVKENGGVYLNYDKDSNRTGYTITVNNSSGSVLPSTGSSRTIHYTALGVTMLLSVGAVLTIRQKIKREE